MDKREILYTKTKDVTYTIAEVRIVGNVIAAPSSVVAELMRMARFQSANVATSHPVNAVATIPATFPDVFMIEERNPA